MYRGLEERKHSMFEAMKEIPSGLWKGQRNRQREAIRYDFRLSSVKVFFWGG